MHSKPLQLSPEGFVSSNSTWNEIRSGKNNIISSRTTQLVFNISNWNIFLEHLSMDSFLGCWCGFSVLLELGKCNLQSSWVVADSVNDISFELFALIWLFSPGFVFWNCLQIGLTRRMQVRNVVTEIHNLFRETSRYLISESIKRVHFEIVWNLFSEEM